MQSTLQPSSSTFRSTAVMIFSQDGLRGLYVPGLTATWMREAMYSSVRFGCYTPVRNFISQSSQGSSFMLKLLSGMIVGAIGSIAASPVDLIKIRMQMESGRISASGLLETGIRKGLLPEYSSLLSSLFYVYKNEGIRGLFAGCSATIMRASLLTGGQLATYDHVKHFLRRKGFEESFKLHIL